jgi:hypothetical protein
MTMISRLASLTLSALLTAGFAAVAQADDPNWDPVTQYIQRSDKITLGAGNANAANAAIHVINPWPRGASNRQIPANGERMSGAYERYRDVSKQPPRPLINPPTVSAGGGAASGGGAAK